MTWPLAKLGDVCELNPKLPKGHPLRDDTEVSFVPMAAVSELSCSITDPQVRPFSEVRKGYTSFCDDDVLFAKITPCMENGKAAIARNLVNGHGFGSTEFHVLRAKAEVLPEWVYFFVRQASFRHEAKRNFTGTGGQQRVPVSFLAGSDIPLPPLPEQRRIVDLLTRAEGIVRLRREAAAKAAELIPALFIHQFGDPATNPMGWPQCTLGDVVNIASGGTPSKARPDFWEGDLPWVSPKDMKRTVIVDAIDHISPKVVEETNLKLVPKDAVLIVVRGMILAHTVPIAITARPVTINQDMKALTAKEGVMPAFLLWHLKVMHHELLGATSTAAHGTKKLETKDLLRQPVVVPPLALQGQFCEQMMAMESIQRQQIDALAKAQATFDALLAQAFAPT
ncbi:MAG: restriction endonuclease subunit S [Gammaproteobacteria bacterium]